MSDEREFLDIKHAAQFLGVSETSLRRWTNAGRLACLRVGRRRERRFRRADLVAFMEDQPADAVGAAPSHPADIGQTIVAGVSLPYGSHLCGLYASDLGRVKLAVGFLADGLRPDSVCYLVAARPVRDQILSRLGRGRASLQPDIDAGRLVLSDYEASARAQWDYFETNFVGATRAGAQSFRVVGDVSGWRLARGKTLDRVVDYEAGYDRLLARRFPVLTLCQYDLRRVSGAALLATLKCHKDTFRYPVERLVS
jgi:transcriptional repressor of dcmA and dcmR